MESKLAFMSIGPIQRAAKTTSDEGVDDWPCDSSLLLSTSSTVFTIFFTHMPKKVKEKEGRIL